VFGSANMKLLCTPEGFCYKVNLDIRVVFSKYYSKFHFAIRVAMTLL
jgi:hypothetical protein